MAALVSYKRVVLSLHHNALDAPSIAFAAELSELLQLDLHGLFVQDESLYHLAGHAGLRELATFGLEWRPMDLGQLSLELSSSARAAERLFAQAAGRLRAASRFEVVRGQVAKTIAAMSRETDIVMVCGPRSPAERLVQPFCTVLDAAFRSTAAVLLVPRTMARRQGPVVALAGGPEDPAIRSAAAIARAAREKLIVFDAGGSLSPSALQALGEWEPTTEIRALPRKALGGARPLADALGSLKERLIVLTRDAVFPDGERLNDLLEARRVPLLVIEPQRLGPPAGA